MATNITVTSIDFKRMAVTSAIETGVVLEGTNTARLVILQALANIIRVSRTPGGTYSTDNYIILDPLAGIRQRLQLDDVALRPLDAVGTFFYARAEASAATLEITWGQ